MRVRAAPDGRASSLTQTRSGVIKRSPRKNGIEVARVAPVAREALVVIAFALMYGAVRELTEGSAAAAIRHGAQIARLEDRLGVAWERAIQSLVLDHAVFVDVANWMYIWGHWPVIAVAAICLFATRRDRYRLLRNAVVISGLIGFLFFALLPLAPPRLAEMGFVDTVTRWSDSYRTLQPPHLTNQYAAMPSLHFGWNLLVGLVLFGTTRSLLLRGFSVLMPLAMAFAVVATANHWVLDVAAGAVTVLVGLLLARLLERRRRVPQRFTRTTVRGQLLYWPGGGFPEPTAGAPRLPRRAQGRERARAPAPRGDARRGARRVRRPELPRAR